MTEPESPALYLHQEEHASEQEEEEEDDEIVCNEIIMDEEDAAKIDVKNILPTGSRRTRWTVNRFTIDTVLCDDDDDCGEADCCCLLSDCEECAEGMDEDSLDEEGSDVDEDYDPCFQESLSDTTEATEILHDEDMSADSESD